MRDKLGDSHTTLYGIMVTTRPSQNVTDIYFSRLSVTLISSGNIV